MALRVGQIAPDFTLENHLGEKTSLSDYLGKKNIFIAFFPLAWTPVWTAQIPSYQVALDWFDRVNTQVLGISVDSKHCLRAWAESLGGISYPLLADFFPHGEVAQRYGVLRPEGTSERALFIIDRSGVIRYVDVHDIEEQPDNEVLFRELAAIEGVPVPQEIIASPPVEEQAEPGEKVDLVMYCTDWCPSCRRARIYLKTNNISYREINITRDRSAAMRVRGWTGGYEATPTFDVNGTIVVNFDVEKLNKLLGIQG